MCKISELHLTDLLLHTGHKISNIVSTMPSPILYSILKFFYKIVNRGFDLKKLSTQ